MKSSRFRLEFKFKKTAVLNGSFFYQKKQAENLCTLI